MLGSCFRTLSVILVPDFFFFMLLSDTGDVAFPSLAPGVASTCIANEAGSVLQAAMRVTDLIVHSISGPA